MGQKLLLAAIIIALAFIWGHSLVPMDMSAQESGWITEHIIAPVLALFGVDEVSTHLVRKIAHVSEFLILALLVCAYLRGRVLKGFYVCFTVAFLDESIQLLSGRGSLISDVWVDLIGVVIGIAVCVTCSRMRMRQADRREIH